MEEPNELDALRARRSAPPRARSAGTSWPQGLGCHGEYVDRIEDLEPALRRAQEHEGPSLVCLRTDHDANLAVPEEMMKRFFEVYFGPAVEQPVEA